MKTFFFSLFLLFLLAFGGAAAFLVTTLEPASFMKEAEHLGVFEAVEKLLPTLARVSGIPDLQENAEQQLGFCRFMTYPDLQVSGSLGRITEMKNEAVPYLEPIALEKRGLQCKFNGEGKSVLLVPQEKTQLTVRRALDRSGTITLTSGEVTVFSDSLDIFFALRGLEIHLRSKTPTVLKLTGKGDSTPYSMYVTFGQVDVAYRRLSAGDQGAGVRFYVSPGAQLSNAGRVLSKPYASLLPSGFASFETDSPASPPPSAPRNPSNKLIADLLHDPIHRPFIGKLVAIVDEFSNRAVKIRLAAAFPSLFGFPFACQFTPSTAGAKPVSILPGEKIEDPAGGKLQCPEHIEVSLAAGGLLQVSRSGETPFFVLERGEAKVSFGEEDFLFSTPGYLSRLKGHGSYQQVTFTSTAGSQALDCGIGEVSALFAATDDTGPSPLLVSRNCRLEVSSAEGAPRTLFGGERIHFGNLSLAQESLPYVPVEELTKFTDYNFSSFVWMTIDPGGSGKATVNLAGKYEGHSCKLYAKKKDLDQPNLIRSFQGQNGMQLQVEPQYVPGYIALVCTDGTNEAASSSVATAKQ